MCLTLVCVSERGDAPEEHGAWAATSIAVGVPMTPAMDSELPDLADRLLLTLFTSSCKKGQS